MDYKIEIVNLRLNMFSGSFADYLSDHATKLNLSGLNLTELPEGIERYKSLLELDCSHNRLEILQLRDTLPQLRKIKCNNNKLTELQLGKTLREINASDNHLETMDFVKGCRGLKKLEFQNNRIEKLKHLGDLSNLEYFDFSGNKISEVSEIGQLKNLLILDASNNQINRLINVLSLEDSVDIRKLAETWDDDFQLCRLEGIGRLHQLRKLFIQGNPLLTLDGVQYLWFLETIDYSPLKLSPNLERCLAEISDRISPSKELVDLATKYYLTIDEPMTEIRPLFSEFAGSNSQVFNSKRFHNYLSTNYILAINQFMSDYYLLADKDYSNQVVSCKHLSEGVKFRILNYCEFPAIHCSDVRITFRELFNTLWYFINNHEQKEQLLSKLQVALDASKCEDFETLIDLVKNSKFHWTVFVDNFDYRESFDYFEGFENIVASFSQILAELIDVVDEVAPSIHLKLNETKDAVARMNELNNSDEVYNNDVDQLFTDLCDDRGVPQKFIDSYLTK